MLRRKAAIVATTICLTLGSMLYAQIRSATITGTVTDAAGAVVPDATVAVTQQETDVVTSTKTTAAGVFTVPYLPAGTFTVSVSKPGFSAYKQTGVVVAGNQTRRIDVDLVRLAHRVPPVHEQQPRNAASRALQAPEIEQRPLVDPEL